MDITKESFEYIISRILDYANEDKKEKDKHNSDFYKGKALAHYEVIDTIKNELEIRDADLKGYGLNIQPDDLL